MRNMRNLVKAMMNSATGVNFTERKSIETNNLKIVYVELTLIIAKVQTLLIFPPNRQYRQFSIGRYWRFGGNKIGVSKGYFFRRRHGIMLAKPTFGKRAFLKKCCLVRTHVNKKCCPWAAFFIKLFSGFYTFLFCHIFKLLLEV